MRPFLWLAVVLAAAGATLGVLLASRDGRELVRLPRPEGVHELATSAPAGPLLPDPGLREATLPAPRTPVAPPPLPLVPPPRHGAGVAGIVLDELGFPTRALVHVVQRDGGSVTLGTGRAGAERGTFAAADSSVDGVVLKAATADGRVAVSGPITLGPGEGTSDLVLRLERGAKVRIRQTGGREHVRCALFQGTARHTDLTLARGTAMTEVVPAGPLRVQLYEGAGAEKIVHAERSLFLQPGSVETLVFALDA